MKQTPNELIAHLSAADQRSFRNWFMYQANVSHNTMLKVFNTPWDELGSWYKAQITSHPVLKFPIPEPQSKAA